MVVATVIGAAVLVAVLVAGLVLWKRDHAPLPPRQDWWPDFEREFRAYAQRQARDAGQARRERPGRGSHRTDNG